jgi:hypothetical protein
MDYNKMAPARKGPTRAANPLKDYHFDGDMLFGFPLSNAVRTWHLVDLIEPWECGRGRSDLICAGEEKNVSRFSDEAVAKER